MDMPWSALAGCGCGCGGTCPRAACPVPPGFAMVSRNQLLGLGADMEAPEPDEDGESTFGGDESPADAAASGAPGVLGAGGLYAAGAAAGIGTAAGGILYHSQTPSRARSKATIKRKEKQSLAAGVGGGAVAGASVGTMIFPGIGTAIGAVVGAGAGGAASYFGSKKLKKANKKLQQQQWAELAAQQAAQAEAKKAELEAQREYVAAVSQARLQLNRIEREADRWALTVQKSRGDLSSARALRQELVAIRAEAMSAGDLETLELLNDQAVASVEELKALAEDAQYAAAPRGLSGLGSATAHVLAARAHNRAQLGLPPEGMAGNGVSAVLGDSPVAHVAFGALAGAGALWFLTRKRR